MTEMPVRAGAELPSRAAQSFLRATLAEMAADRLLYAIIGVYLAAALAMAASVGLLGRINVLTYLPVWAYLLMTCVMVYVLIAEVPRCIRADPRAPISKLVERFRQADAPRLVAGLTLMLAVGLFMGVFTTIKTMLPHLTEFRWDAAFAELDFAIHGADPWRLLHPILGHPPITQAIEFVYLTVWAVLIVAAPAWAIFADIPRGRRQRYLLTYFLCWIVLGNVAAGVFFSAGPCYFLEVTGDDRFAALIAYHEGNVDAATLRGVQLLQDHLWSVFEQGRMEVGSGISAFPSLHVSMATMIVIMAFCINRKLGFASLGYLLLIQVSSVHLAWHYAVDGYASIAVTLAIWFALRPLEKTEPSHAAQPAPAAA
jgi:hypothetical protein